MPKAYWIARMDVSDPETYKRYVEGAAPAFAKYGARFLARGGKVTALEGEARGRNVVTEFPSVEDALACYHSPEYQAAMKHRHAASVGELTIVEGFDPPNA